jgi:hypothetical protein
MSSFKNFTAAVAVLASTSLCSAMLNAEPLMTIFDFSKGAYTDTLTTNSVVVTITRADQDPGATDNEPFTVDVKKIGGTAMENQDYRLGFTWPASGIWKVTFPPGVKEQSFTITTIKHPGPNTTLRFELSNPEGPRSSVTGNNPTATVTIVNPPPPPPPAKNS